jgi:hypothetical protein
MQLTTINLTDADAQQFVRFQKHKALIDLLENVGAFDIKNGSVTLHFGMSGEVKTIDRHEYFHL